MCGKNQNFSLIFKVGLVVLWAFNKGKTGRRDSCPACFLVSFILSACADAADAVLVDAECLGTAFVKDAAHTVVGEFAAL